MTSEEFVDKVKGTIGMDGVDAANAEYKNIVEQYISSNSPHKVGVLLKLKDIGMRHDLEEHRKKKRTFEVKLITVGRKPDLTPYISVVGDVLFSERKGRADAICTFQCVVHGITMPVIFETQQKN